MKGRNDPATFLPNSQGPGENKSVISRNKDCLTPRQMNFNIQKGRIR